MKTNERKYNVYIEGRKMCDTAKSIFHFLITKRFDGVKISLEEFINEVQHNLWRLFGIGVQINNEVPINQKCDQLMEQLIDHNLIMTND